MQTNIIFFKLLPFSHLVSWKWKNVHDKWKTILPKDILGDSFLDLLLMCIYDNTFLKVQNYASVAATCPVLFGKQIFYSASKNMITSDYWHDKFKYKFIGFLSDISGGKVLIWLFFKVQKKYGFSTSHNSKYLSNFIDTVKVN